VAGSSAWNSGMPGRDLTVDGARLRAGGTGAGAGGRQARIGRPENAQNLWTRVLAAVAQVPQHCQHPPVILGDGVQAQFREDAADVLLDGAVGDDELLGDADV